MVKGTLATLVLPFLIACISSLEPAPVLVALPTFTPTATVTPTFTPTLTPTPRPTRGPTGTPTLTPEPWLQIELSITDAETGEAVAGDVYIGLMVDDKQTGYLVEEDVHSTTLTLPRGIMRADVVFINILADGYVNRMMRLPREARSLAAITLKAQLRKSSR